MWISEILVLVNTKNADGNSLDDLATAMNDVGGAGVEVDQEQNTISAILPSSTVPTVALMEGVTYVRPIMTYFKSDT
jgi:hypothetical protein